MHARVAIFAATLALAGSAKADYNDTIRFTNMPNTTVWQAGSMQAITFDATPILPPYRAGGVSCGVVLETLDDPAAAPMSLGETSYGINCGAGYVNAKVPANATEGTYRVRILAFDGEARAHSGPVANCVSERFQVVNATTSR